MPSYCPAYGCRSTYGRDEVAFHMFPWDQKMAATWAAVVKRNYVFHTFEMKRSVAVANLPNFEAVTAPLLYPHLHALRAEHIW